MGGDEGDGGGRDDSKVGFEWKVLDDGEERACVMRVVSDQKEEVMAWKPPHLLPWIAIAISGQRDAFAAGQAPASQPASRYLSHRRRSLTGHCNAIQSVP